MPPLPFAAFRIARAPPTGSRRQHLRELPVAAATAASHRVVFTQRFPALLGGADMEERNGSTGSTSQAVNHGHHGHRHGHHDHTTTPPRPPAPALPSPGTGWWCWRRADDWAVVVERVAVLLGRRFRVVAPPLAPRSIARLSSFSAPRHVDAHTLGARDWLRSDCPDDFEPSQTHKVGVWEINAPIFTAARRHQVHHGNVSIRKDGFPQQSSCHGNCRSTKKEGIYV